MRKKVQIKTNGSNKWLYPDVVAVENLAKDWNITNRLVEENSDFKNFIDTISDFYRNGRKETLEELLK